MKRDDHEADAKAYGRMEEGKGRRGENPPGEERSTRD